MPDFLLDKKDPKYQDHRDHLLAAITFADKPLIVRIQQQTTERSVPINRYYFGVVVKMVAQHTGISIYMVHKMFKNGPLKYVIWSDFWEMDLSTANMASEDMWDLCCVCRDWRGSFWEFLFRILKA